MNTELEVQAPDFRHRVVLNSYSTSFKTSYTFLPGQLSRLTNLFSL